MSRFSDRRRQLTRQRVQRHGERTDEVRRETVRAADRKRKKLGRQSEVDIRRSQPDSPSLVIMFCNCQINIKASREAFSAWSTTYALVNVLTRFLD